MEYLRATIVAVRILLISCGSFLSMRLCCPSLPLINVSSLLIGYVNCTYVRFKSKKILKFSTSLSFHYQVEAVRRKT